MTIPIEKPEWNPNAKEESLELYASWLNEIARAAFLETGSHPQMFFFITDDGEIKGCQFRDGLDQKKRNEVLFQQAAEIKPFGTIQIIITQIYHPKLAGHDNVRFAGSNDPDDKETVRDCLLIRMLSRNGKDKSWANPILRDGNHAFLADCVVTYPQE